MSGSLALEGPLQVACLGPSATFTHLACIQKFGSSAQYVPLTSIKDVFNEVERGRSDFGVVPIENSTEGVVNHTLDMFIDSNLLIYGEVQQEVSHHLLSKADSLGGIKKIYSHPHAIAQCRNWLETNLPGVPVSEVHSTARAAEIAAEDPTTAAIASELAGQIYGLKVLKAASRTTSTTTRGSWCSPRSPRSGPGRTRRPSCCRSRIRSAPSTNSSGPSRPAA